ncbi:MAG: nucleoid-associated protein EbfC [Actinomycetota bacterium]|jgi:DNA-binding YbaB/EbfC family protein|nr:nucleoid-associated protein EbfC [Actinomycetota bacterium]
MASPDQMKMLRKVQQMQADMEATQAALATEVVEGSAGGGMVKVTVSGSGEVRRVSIDPSVVDPEDIETLEDLVVAAVADGLRRAAELQSTRLGAVTGGLDLGSLGLGGLGLG